MPRPLLLVHSPLVGPSSLERLAQVAKLAGHVTALPDLTGLAGAPNPHAHYVDRAAAAGLNLPSQPVAIGHLGAGAFLPAIAARLASSMLVVFLDAVIPPPNGPYRNSPQFLEFVASKREGDRLLQWLDWWPKDAAPLTEPDQVFEAVSEIFD